MASQKILNFISFVIAIFFWKLIASENRAKHWEKEQKKLVSITWKYISGNKTQCHKLDSVQKDPGETPRAS